MMLFNDVVLQGMWEKRFICTVPHLFLYYFQSDSSDAPRGIIDLELFSNISRDGSNLMTIAPTQEHEALRTFFFREEDQDSLNDWVSSLLRDRYFSILEERNAYMQMQSDLTGTCCSSPSLNTSHSSLPSSTTSQSSFPSWTKHIHPSLHPTHSFLHRLHPSNPSLR